VLFLYYLYFGLRNGWGTLNGYEPSGPYKIGTRVFWTKSLSTQVLVYYPISVEEYDEKIGDNNMPYNLNQSIELWLEGNTLAGIPAVIMKP